MKIWMFFKSQHVEFEQLLRVSEKYLFQRSIHESQNGHMKLRPTTLPPLGHAHLFSVEWALVQPPWRGRGERDELGLREVTDSSQRPFCPSSDAVEPDDEKRQQNKTSVKNNCNVSSFIRPTHARTLKTHSMTQHHSSHASFFSSSTDGRRWRSSSSAPFWVCFSSVALCYAWSSCWALSPGNSMETEEKDLVV